MPSITYIEFNGAEHLIEAPTGMSVMQGAVYNGVPGIDATCGGACACATCHVFVDPAWLDAVGAPGPEENELLEFANSRQANSRLSCQIPVGESLDGLVVRLPESQA